MDGRDEPLVTYTYAPNNGKLASMTYGNGKTVAYRYDELDRVAEMCYTDHNGLPQSDKYTYTATGLLYSVESTESGRTLLYSYDTNGRLLGKVEQLSDDAGNTSVATESIYDYDEQDRLSTLQNFVTAASGSTTVWTDTDYSYTYDDSNTAYTSGNIGALQELLVSGGGLHDSLTVGYDYDALFRLSAKEYDSPDGFWQLTEYEYKNIGTDRTTARVESYRVYIGLEDTANDKAYTYNTAGHISLIVDQEWQVHPLPIRRPGPAHPRGQRAAGQELHLHLRQRRQSDEQKSLRLHDRHPRHADRHPDLHRRPQGRHDL